MSVYGSQEGSPRGPFPCDEGDIVLVKPDPGYPIFCHRGVSGGSEAGNLSLNGGKPLAARSGALGKRRIKQSL